MQRKNDAEKKKLETLIRRFVISNRVRQGSWTEPIYSDDVR